MPNIVIGPLPIPVTGPLLWLLKKLVEHLPAVILPQALSLLDQMMDAKTPAWKRAAIAAALIELVALINASVPVSLLVRIAVLHAAFNGQALQQQRHVQHGEPTHVA